MADDVQSVQSEDIDETANPTPSSSTAKNLLEKKTLGELPPADAGGDDDEDSEQSENTDEEGEKGPALPGGYDASEYEDLPVSPDIKELFQYITAYTPQNIELDTKLRAFIPEYIPAVGDIDAFIKVSRPDGKPDTLGFTALDEPSGKQSDPTVLDLQLRALAKTTASRAVAVKMVKHAEKNTKLIDKWIKDINDLHRSKPPPSVHYSKPMPDIDTLMQEWPTQFEDLLKDVGLPTADLDCDLYTYVETLCTLLDIPVYKGGGDKGKGYIHALHLLFTLYSTFRTSQHFQHMKQPEPDEEMTDRLVL